MRQLLLLFIAFLFLQCKTAKKEVVADIKSYISQVHGKEVVELTLIDNDASCKGATESYVYAATGIDKWFKWEDPKSAYGYICVYTMPVNFTNYKCNPKMFTDMNFLGYEKVNDVWMEMDYTSNVRLNASTCFR